MENIQFLQSQSLNKGVRAYHKKFYNLTSSMRLKTVAHISFNQNVQKVSMFNLKLRKHTYCPKYF